MNWKYSFGLRLILSPLQRKLFLLAQATAVLGIVFGLSALLITQTVFTGFQTVFKKAILGFNAHLVIVGPDEQNEASFIISALKPFEKDGIVGMSPFVFREGLGLLTDGVSSVVMKGIEADKITEVYPLQYRLFHSEKSISDQLGETRFEEEGELIPPVILGRLLYEKFFPVEGGLGDNLSPENERNQIVKFLIPRGADESPGKSAADFARTFRVIGTFESGIYEFDSQFVLASLSMMQSLFSLKKNVSGWEITLKEPHLAPALARKIEGELPPSFQVISWDELNGPLFDAMKMEKTLFLVIMFVIILIASFNIVGVIMMMIWHRQREIGILKALGARALDLTSSFSFQGLFFAVSGSLLGSGVSVVLLYSLEYFNWVKLDPQIYFVSRLPVVWPISLWIVLMGATVALCYVTSMGASYFALRKRNFLRTFR